MLKLRHIVTLFTICLSVGAFGQELPYEFTAAPNLLNYQPLDAMTATSLNNGEVWDDPEYSVPIGFDFPIWGESINTVVFPGFVGPYLTGSQNPSPMLIPYGADLSDRGFGTGTSQSPILYELRGDAPNRIFIIEWQNAGFYNEVSAGINVSFVNVQMWLYESGRIDYCFGANNIENNNDIFDGSPGPVIGFNDSYSSDTGDFGTFFYMQGDAANPTVTTATIDDFPIPTTITGTPPENQLYLFIPEDVSNLDEQQLAAGLKTFPNPVREELKVELDFPTSSNQLTIRLLNAIGQEVYRQREAATINTELTIDMSPFPAGIYFLEVTDQQASASRTILKE